MEQLVEQLKRWIDPNLWRGSFYLEVVMRDGIFISLALWGMIIIGTMWLIGWFF